MSLSHHVDIPPREFPEELHEWYRSFMLSDPKLRSPEQAVIYALARNQAVLRSLKAKLADLRKRDDWPACLASYFHAVARLPDIVPMGDGITLAGDLIVEVKCPFRGRQSKLWREAREGTVPAYYAAQIQHQLMVSGAAEAHLWVYVEGEGLLLTLRRDVTAMEAIRGAWDTFSLYLDGDNPPPLSEADSAQRDDPAWGEAATAFVAAKRNADSAEEALDAARQRLVDLAMHPRETGGGVSVVRLWKAGNVDYKKVPELRGVDLDRYRGKGREEVRVTVAR